MNTHSVLLSTQPEDPSAPQRWQVLRRLLAAALGVTGLALAWLGGAAGLVGALAAAVAAGVALPRQATTGTGTAQRAQADRGGRHGAEVMVAQVVPVWSRQLEVTRDAASDGLAAILGTFSEMSESLGVLTSGLEQLAVHAEPGAVDATVRREDPALTALTAASARAFAERDAVVAELGRCVEGLKELQHLAKQARELARHTRLVAFNASIEARRASGQSEGGSQAVASELRMLADRMADTGTRIDRVVLGLAGPADRLRRQGEISDTSLEELRLEIDLRAREALAAMLGSLGGSLRSSGQIEQASRTVRDQLDAAFVNFQFGDRVSQMLSIVANDMNNFTDWVAANPHATQTDAAEWLATLVDSYTMDEQRSRHHGNVVVDHQSGVDFF